MIVDLLTKDGLKGKPPIGGIPQRLHVLIKSGNGLLLTLNQRRVMRVNKLEDLVVAEYHRLNIKDGRYTIKDIAYKAPETLGLQSNQVRALLNVIAPLIKVKPNKGEVK